VRPETVKAARYQLVNVGVIPPSRLTEKRLPEFKPLPRQPPELAEGRCVGHEQAGWWTSDDPHEQAMAIGVCRGCHVIESCLRWSLSLPLRDTAIYGGVTSTERRRLRYLRAGEPVPAYMSARARHAVRDRKRAEARAERAARKAAS
jgi:Transcription factor WhiB